MSEYMDLQKVADMKKQIQNRLVFIHSWMASSQGSKRFH